ncbi:hypothetical protein A3197_12105 [Candidatus Thiodiazotropha endoloripes]|nr:hypothetical protein A3197_12105 [Candidatus Thiodiazotropha endoloripes]
MGELLITGKFTTPLFERQHRFAGTDLSNAKKVLFQTYFTSSTGDMKYEPVELVNLLQVHHKVVYSAYLKTVR